MFFMRSLVPLFWLIGILTAQIPETAAFKSGVTQVRLDVLATNDKGFVKTLKAEDLVIEDEGQAVKISYFGRDESALNLLLLLDVSGSMRTYLSQIGRRAQALLSEMKPKDKVGVMIFAKESDYLMPFNANMDRVANAIDQALRPDLLPSGTSINAGLIDAAQAFIENPKLDGHRTVIILTDNKALNYRVPDSEVLRNMFAADAVLNSIVTKNAEPPKPVKNPEQRNPDFSWADVFKLSAETGGEVLRTDRADEAFAKLLGNLRERYLITYDAPAAEPNQFRRVKVSLTKEAAKKYGKVLLRVRSGYYTRS
jgi:VWFA-related protein